MLVAAGAMLAGIAAFGWLGTCSRLSADDYLWALGPPGAAMSITLSNYNFWTGCYSCIFFLVLLLPISPNIVMVLPAAALGLWLLALLALFHGLFRRLFRGLLANRTWSASLLGATATLWATVDSTSSAGQSLYWADGMIKYTVPLVLLTFTAALIIVRSSAQSGALSRTERIPGVVVCTLTALLMFICGGFSETTLALQMTAVVIALLLLWTAVANRSLRHPGEVRLPIRLSRILLVSFMATAASVLVGCLARGNAIRQAGLGPPAMT